MIVGSRCETPHLVGATIEGDLVLEPFAAVVVLSHSSIQGRLIAMEGARITCDRNSSANYAGFLYVGESSLQGTAEGPVVIDRQPAGGNASCRMGLGISDADHVRFTGVHPSFSASSEIRDSIFEMLPGPFGEVILARMWVRGTGSTFEYNRFERAILRGSDFTARHNEFVIPYHFGGVHLCIDCPSVATGFEGGCSGDRSADPGVVFEGNVIDAYYGGPGVMGASVFDFDRDFGPVDFSGNYFVSGLPPSSDTWDGASGGCPEDELGRHGGPLDLTPTLDEPPATYGPDFD